MNVPKARKLPSGNYCIELRLGGERISITRRTEKDCKREAQIVKAEYLAGKREKHEAAPTLGEAIIKAVHGRSVEIPALLALSGLRRLERLPDNAQALQTIGAIGQGKEFRTAQTMLPDMTCPVFHPLFHPLFL